MVNQMIFIFCYALFNERRKGEMEFVYDDREHN